MSAGIPGAEVDHSHPERGEAAHGHSDDDDDHDRQHDEEEERGSIARHPADRRAGDVEGLHDVTDLGATMAARTPITRAKPRMASTGTVAVCMAPPVVDSLVKARSAQPFGVKRAMRCMTVGDADKKTKLPPRRANPKTRALDIPSAWRLVRARPITSEVIATMASTNAAQMST